MLNSFSSEERAIKQALAMSNSQAQSATFDLWLSVNTVKPRARNGAESITFTLWSVLKLVYLLFIKIIEPVLGAKVVIA